MLLNPLDRRAREHQGFPVMRGAFPLVGHLPAIVCNLPDLLRQAGREIGPHFWLDLGPSGMSLVCLHFDAYSLFKNKVTTSCVIEDMSPEVFGHSIVAEDGPHHRSVRAAMNGSFQPKGLTAAEIGPLFAGMIERRMALWRARGEINLLWETRDLMLALVFRMLGVEETEFSVWNKKYKQFMQLVVAPPIDFPGMPLSRGRSARAWIDEQLRGFIDQARRQPEVGGLLAALVRSFDGSDGQLSDADLLANLRLLILAGHDTAASTMAWVVVELAQRPEVWDALCDEANRIGSVPRGPKDLADCRVAEALFRETLRFRPAVPLTHRRALVDLELGERTVAKGAHLTIPIGHLSRHPGLCERPDEFDLERWLGRHEGIKPAETLQFGSGPHQCLGYHLAWMQVVQFCIALARTMSASGLRPRLLANPFVGQRYYPTTHPSAALRVAFG